MRSRCGAGVIRMNEQPMQLATIRDTAARAKAEGLGVSEKALRAWIAEGKLAFVPSGNRRLIFWPTLMAFLTQGQKIDTTPRPYFGRGSKGGVRR